jgi:hypothetical protein
MERWHQRQCERQNKKGSVLQFVNPRGKRFIVVNLELSALSRILPLMPVPKRRPVGEGRSPVAVSGATLQRESTSRSFKDGPGERDRSVANERRKEQADIIA